jgi:hypothetical protein
LERFKVSILVIREDNGKDKQMRKVTPHGAKKVKKTSSTPSTMLAAAGSFGSWTTNSN